MKKNSYSSQLPAIAICMICSIFAVPAFSQTATGSGQNPLFRHIPPNARDVYHINLPVLTSKVSWEKLTGVLPGFQKASQNVKWLEILKDPGQAGIDVNRDIFFTLTNNEVMDSTGYTTIIAHLTDSGKFVSYLKQLMPGVRLFTIPGKGRSAGKDMAGFAWDNNLLVATIIRPAISAPGKASATSSGASGPGAHPSPAHPTLTSPIALKAARQSLAALHGFDRSFYTTDPVFTNGFSDDADLHIWAAQGAGMAMISKNLFHTKTSPPAPGSAKDKKQSNALTAVRFDAGRITIHSTTVVSPDLAPVLAQFNGHPLNTDLLTRIPPGNILGMVNLHFDPAAILAVMDKFKVRAKFDSLLATKGLTLDDIQQAFKGDFLLAVVQPSQQPADSASTMERSKTPDIYFVTTLGNGQSLAKVAGRLGLLKGLANKDSTEANAGAPSGLLGKLKTAFTLQDNILVISRNKTLTDSYFSNKEKRNTDFVTQAMKDNPSSIYLDFRSVAAFLKSMSAEPSEKDRQMIHILQSFDQLIFTIGALKDNKSESMVELKMTDPSENSLRSLYKLLR